MDASEREPKQRDTYKPRQRTTTPFDWHADPIARTTPVTPTYRTTQNVRRFLLSQCGEQFSFDRSFMRWITDGTEKTMGDVADEWLRRNRSISN
jgi:hypothetical protein